MVADCCEEERAEEVARSLGGSGPSFSVDETTNLGPDTDRLHAPPYEQTTISRSTAGFSGHIGPLGGLFLM